ncbi:MAG: glycosyltransferase [Candidatus Rokubacteria bacterium]|nr:glycosyltransferase [Candidatus Rokubacteria bacterium]
MAPDPDLPSVSVLIITKDRRALLSQALRSIGAVDYPKHKLEIVVVEDTGEPLAPPGVVYITQPCESRGRSAARNVSVQASTAEILAFTDDDCVVDGQWLRELVGPLVLNPDVAGVGGAVFPLRPGLIGLCEHVLGYPGGGLRYIYAARGEIVETHQLNTVNCAYRRRILLEAGGFHPKSIWSGEDYLLAREVTARHRCLFNPRAIVYHQARGHLRGVFVRWFNFGRGEIEMLGFLTERGWLLRFIMRGSVGLKYLGLLLILWLAHLNLLWILAAAAVHYGCLVFSYRFASRYIPWRAVLWAAPAVRFVADLGLDAGRVWGLLERIPRRWRR